MKFIGLEKSRRQAVDFFSSFFSWKINEYVERLIFRFTSLVSSIPDLYGSLREGMVSTKKEGNWDGKDGEQRKRELRQEASVSND